MTDLVDAFSEGREARSLGYEREQNPYEDGTDNYWDWMNGYDSVDGGVD